MVLMFMSEIKTLRFEEGLYFNRANARKAFKKYTRRLGIQYSQLTPKQFYQEVLAFINETAPELVTLSRVKGYDVFLGVTCEEFYDENDTVQYDRIDAYIDELKALNRG